MTQPPDPQDPQLHPGSPESSDPRADPPTDPVDQPIVVEGEIVDDDDRAFRTFPQRSSGGWREPGGSVGTSDTIGVPGGVGGMFAAGEIFRLLTGNQDVRALLTTPLRILSFAILAPTLIAGLLGFAIDSGARVLGFVLAGAGILTAGLITGRRRRIIRGSPTSTRYTKATEPGREIRPKALVGLVGIGVLLIMLGVGFDLLALLLLAFGIW